MSLAFNVAQGLPITRLPAVVPERPQLGGKKAMVGRRPTALGRLGLLAAGPAGRSPPPCVAPGSASGPWGILRVAGGGDRRRDASWTRPRSASWARSRSATLRQDCRAGPAGGPGARPAAGPLDSRDQRPSDEGHGGCERVGGRSEGRRLAFDPLSQAVARAWRPEESVSPGIARV